MGRRDSLRDSALEHSLGQVAKIGDFRRKTKVDAGKRKVGERGDDCKTLLRREDAAGDCASMGFLR